jgi:hypothetical protein
VERDLRIGRLIEGIGWADALRLAETIDLNDPGRNGALGRLPDDCVEEVGGPTVWMLQGIRRA